MKKIDFDVVVFLERDSYVAYTPELDVSSCGKSVDEARRNLLTVVRLFIEEAEKLGTLNQILDEAGYVPDGNGGYKPPRLIATEAMSVAMGSG